MADFIDAEGSRQPVVIRVWDFPLRLFHWLLVLAVVFSIVSGELGGNLMDWHERSGLLILGLLVFRLLWGFIGSRNARFCNFFPTPSRLTAYLRGNWQGQGHTPLGALSVIALLLILTALVGTGLFANDDITFQGPLFALVSKDASDKLSGWHDKLFYVLAALAILHIAAIVFYARVKKRNLVMPMLTGKKTVSAHDAPSAQSKLSCRSIAWRFLAALLISGAAVCVVNHGVKKPAPPPAQKAPAAATPDW